MKVACCSRCGSMLLLLPLLQMTSLGSGVNLEFGELYHATLGCLELGTYQQLNLSCVNHSLIYVTDVRHGHSDQSQATCTPDVDYDSWCVDRPPYDEMVIIQCNSRRNCTVDTSEMPNAMYTCHGRPTNVIQATYRCLPGADDGLSLKTDICGSVETRERNENATVGFITSPNYPSRYSPDTNCQCILNVSTEHARAPAQILIRVLDHKLSRLPSDLSPADWVEYVISGRQRWADGTRITGDVINGVIRTGADAVKINFRSDVANEQRGFWLAYSAQTMDDRRTVPVSIDCHVFTPAELRTEVSCFKAPQQGELYLSCKTFGIIAIVRALIGSRRTDDVTSSLVPCHVIGSGEQRCMEDDPDTESLYSRCMARSTCVLPVYSKTLSSCDLSSSSDFIQVQYRCISDNHQHFSICGHNTRRGKQHRRPVDATVGYVSSVNYPAPYPPDTNCHCLLATPRPDAQIVFYVLDMKLAAPPGESMCNYDWVEYSTGRGVGRGVKSKLCSWSPHVPVYTASNHVTLAFHADSTLEDRGFWIQFAGRSADGRNVPVSADCAYFHYVEPTADWSTDGVTMDNGPTGNIQTSYMHATGAVDSELSTQTLIQGQGQGQVGSEGPPESQIPDRPSTVNNEKTGLVVGLVVLTFSVVTSLLLFLLLCCRHGTSRGLDMTTTTPGRRSCCATAADSDEVMASLSSRCELTAAAADQQDVKSHHDSAAICYFNPIYSPARRAR